MDAFAICFEQGKHAFQVPIKGVSELHSTAYLLHTVRNATCRLDLSKTTVLRVLEFTSFSFSKCPHVAAWRSADVDGLSSFFLIRYNEDNKCLLHLTMCSLKINELNESSQTVVDFFATHFLLKIPIFELNYCFVFHRT